MFLHLQAENEFRSRLNEMIQEFKAFDPEKYIKNVIAKWAVFYRIAFWLNLVHNLYKTNFIEKDSFVLNFIFNLY